MNGILIFLAFVTSISVSQQDEIVTMSAVKDFSLAVREGKAPNRLPYNPYHIEKEWNALAGDDLNFAFHMASAEGEFKGRSGFYSVTLQTLTERDGECAYNVYVNGKAIGMCQKNPPTNEFCAPAMLKWSNVEIPAKARIRVESNSYSNLRRPEMNFFEYARGRWTGIVFNMEQNNLHDSTNIVNPSLFDLCKNIGSSEIKPEKKYDTPSLSYYLIAAGTGPGNNKDSFGFIHKKTNGDFILECGVKLLNISGNNSSSAGIMVRQSYDQDVPFIACHITGDGTLKINYRASTDKTTRELIIKVADAEMIQIEKEGESFTVSAAKFGEEYKRTSLSIQGINSSLLAGFFVCSGSETKKEAAAFSNIRYFEQ